MKDEERSASRAESGDIREVAELREIGGLREVTELREVAEDEGGEGACWLHRLCPQCDAVQDAPHPATCWRCGAELLRG